MVDSHVTRRVNGPKRVKLRQAIIGIDQDPCNCCSLLGRVLCQFLPKFACEFAEVVILVLASIVDEGNISTASKNGDESVRTFFSVGSDTAKRIHETATQRLKASKVPFGIICQRCSDRLHSELQDCCRLVQPDPMFTAAFS